MRKLYVFRTDILKMKICLWNLSAWNYNLEMWPSVLQFKPFYNPLQGVPVLPSSLPHFIHTLYAFHIYQRSSNLKGVSVSAVWKWHPVFLNSQEECEKKNPSSFVSPLFSPDRLDKVRTHFPLVNLDNVAGWWTIELAVWNRGESRSRWSEASSTAVGVYHLQSWLYTFYMATGCSELAVNCPVSSRSQPVVYHLQ